MRSTSSNPWLSLITLLLLGSGLSWYLGTKDGDQHWLVLVAAWAGASAGTLAMPFFELLAKLLANLISRRTLAAAVAIGISFALALATRSILITEVGVGEVTGNVFFIGFIVAFSPWVFYEAHHFVREDNNRTWEKINVPSILDSTILITVLALNDFEFNIGIAGFAFAIVAYGALVYATVQVNAWIVVCVRPATSYSAFQSLQILALIFGVGLGLGWVTTSLLI